MAQLESAAKNSASSAIQFLSAVHVCIDPRPGLMPQMAADCSVANSVTQQQMMSHARIVKDLAAKMVSALKAVCKGLNIQDCAYQAF